MLAGEEAGDEGAEKHAARETGEAELRRFNEVAIPGSREPQLWKDISKFFLRASTLKFDDSEKQKKYEIVSFEEINKEVNDLKVLLLRDNKVLAS